MKALALVPLLVALLGVVGGEAQELARVPLVLHVHSDLSTGDRSVEELLKTLRAQGIGGLLLAENYLARVEYGFEPFRALTHVTYEERSVMHLGPDRFLARISRARRANPDMLLLPGVEVIPHQFWSGSPAGLAMTLHNTQKNLLVFGVEDPAGLRSLPVTGNPYTRGYGRQSLVDALPALLIVPGLVLFFVHKVRRQRVGSAIIIVRHRRFVLGTLLLLIGVVDLVRGWPFTVDEYPPWRDFGLAPHQALIDHVEGLGGATVWSFPEAWDEGRRPVGPVAVSWRTDAYPDDLLRTFRYTAFGALYDQPARFILPGGGWDRLLVEYAAGERSRPAWGVGESGFHGTAGGKRLEATQTVFLVRERTERAVLDALKRGRMYALQRTPEGTLVLADWSVTAGDTAAVSGETLRVPEGTPVEVRIAVDATGAGADTVRVSLVRNGAFLNAWSGETSVRATHREVFDGRPLVFRIDARGRVPHRIISNPIFVVRP